MLLFQINYWAINLIVNKLELLSFLLFQNEIVAIALFSLSRYKEKLSSVTS